MRYCDLIAVSALIVEMRRAGVPRLRAMLDAKEALTLSAQEVIRAVEHADRVLAEVSEFDAPPMSASQ